jgi:hypothetical protein
MKEESFYNMVQYSPPACESQVTTAYSTNNKVDKNYYVQWN